MKKLSIWVLLLFATVLLGLGGCKNDAPKPEATGPVVATLTPPEEYPAVGTDFLAGGTGGEYPLYPEDEYVAPQEEYAYPLEEYPYPFNEESTYPYPDEAGGSDAQTGSGYPGAGEMDGYPYPQQEQGSDQGPSRESDAESPSELPPTPESTPVLVNPYVINTSTPMPIFSQKGLRATDPSSVALVSGKVQLVEFFAFWSVTCKAIEPEITELEREFGEQVNFIYLDVDDPAVNAFKEALDFKMTPHFFLLDAQGQVLGEWLDFISQDEIKSAIEHATQ